ncbi:Kp4-domain-containing protein [Lasiosphaeria ovina]|uniref:Kp4-domain-containing protein n=1 Tax=Lasiosphaeria ovina TaxID=92902 RepID=A0AAE0K3R1_9PEZI|nr:Kp4-domain-containing protein [Lasiosphaeria ovina]
MSPKASSPPITSPAIIRSKALLARVPEAPHRRHDRPHEIILPSRQPSMQRNHDEAALASITGVNGLGINCQGSSRCISAGPAASLAGVLQGLNDNTQFPPGVQLACVTGSLCAFTQNLPAGVWLTGAEIKNLAQQIVNHGCKKCGSAPSAQNEVSRGELTFNFVNGVWANGDTLCPGI